MVIVKKRNTVAVMADDSVGVIFEFESILFTLNS